jgi:hypothetical protein
MNDGICALREEAYCPGLSITFSHPSFESLVRNYLGVSVAKNAAPKVPWGKGSV